MKIKDLINIRHEIILKFTLILFSFVIFSFIFGYYWLLLAGHSNRSSNLVKNSLNSYFDLLENNSLIDENGVAQILKILGESGSSIIITDENNKPLVWYNIHVKNNPAESLEIIKKYNDKPLIYNGNYQKRIIYYMPDDVLYKMRYYPIFLVGFVILVAIMKSNRYGLLCQKKPLISLGHR